ncbi:hypothetical protein ACROYT_G044610 [Oculina patagonica]
MNESASQGRRQSQVRRYSRTLSDESSQSRNENQRRISVDSSQGRQRRVSVDSVSERKYSQEGTSRKISVPGARRISGASYFSNWKKPAETCVKDDKKRCFENTYRLEPKIRFPEGKVRAVIKEALDTLVSHTYSANHSPFVAKLLSARVLENVKQLNIERYKVVCLVTIGSKERQGLRIASRCLWNDQFDTFVSVCFEGEHFFAVGTVYGVYFE